MTRSSLLVLRALLLLPGLVVLGCRTDVSVGSNVVAADGSPRDAPPRPACHDRLDNDDDGVIDYPFEPGCESPNDDDEGDPLVAPRCSDGLDNDGDGRIDHPVEPGCDSAADDDESDPPTIPECSDGLDNDSDGVADYPDDIGCINAADTMEFSVTS